MRNSSGHAAEPGNEDALSGLAEAYGHLGDFVAAESTYKKAVALRPDYWGVYSWLGAFYSGQNRYSDAAAAFLKVTELHLETTSVIPIWLALMCWRDVIRTR